MDFHFINRRRSKPDSNSEGSDSNSVSAGSDSTANGSRRYGTLCLILKKKEKKNILFTSTTMHLKIHVGKTTKV